MRTITITRGHDDGIQVVGDLNYKDINWAFHCKTLERPWVNNKPQVSCIPKGTYTCKWTFSPRMMRYTYEIQDVPGRSGIRIHKGSYFFDVVGCILLGDGYIDLNHDGELDIVNSTKTIGIFESMMKKQDFTLIIS